MTATITPGPQEGPLTFHRQERSWTFAPVTRSLVVLGVAGRLWFGPRVCSDPPNPSQRP